MHVARIRTKADTNALYDPYKQLAHVKKYYKKGVQRLHTDGGGEYANIEDTDLTETCPHTPQHNPYSKRVNRTLVEPAGVMLEQAGLSAKYWEFAVEYAAYVRHRLPHSSLKISPYEKLTAQKPRLTVMRVFGCSAFVYNENPKSKFHSTGQAGIMLGCNDQGVYTVELVASKQTVNSVHVKFDELSFPGLNHPDSDSSTGESEFWDNEVQENSPESEDISNSDSDISDIFPTDFENPKKNTVADENDSNEYWKDSLSSSDQGPAQTLAPRRSTRNKKTPAYYGNKTKQRKHKAKVIKIPTTTSDEPSVKEALNATSAEVKLWREAIDEELGTLQDKGTWSETDDKAAYEPALPSHLVLKIKRNKHGQAKKFKARIVPGGNRQVHHRDSDKIFAPVVDSTVCLLVLLLAFVKGWFTRHIDVKAVFLNGDIDRIIFIRHP